VARADLAGILPLFDPARVQAEATIASARQMGVNLKMVTGDQTAIAKETAKQPGIGYEDPGCRRIGRYQAPRVGAVGQAIEKADGFAQVFPEHKYHIVDVL
jgi:H+-transporting ATPase